MWLYTCGHKCKYKSQNVCFCSSNNNYSGCYVGLATVSSLVCLYILSLFDILIKSGFVKFFQKTSLNINNCFCLYFRLIPIVFILICFICSFFALVLLQYIHVETRHFSKFLLLKMCETWELFVFRFAPRDYMRQSINYVIQDTFGESFFLFLCIDMVQRLLCLFFKQMVFPILTSNIVSGFSI